MGRRKPDRPRRWTETDRESRTRGIVELAAVHFVEETLIGDGLVHDTRDRIAAGTHEAVVGIDIVERRVARIVEAIEDELENGGGKIGREIRKPVVRRADARVLLRASARFAEELRAVIVAGVISAEGFAKDGTVRVTLANQPPVPAGAGAIGFGEKRSVAVRPIEIPGGGGDGTTIWIWLVPKLAFLMLQGS
jgi:hypothetical protein